MVSESNEVGVQRWTIAKHMGTRVFKDATRRRWGCDATLRRAACAGARRFFRERSQKRLSCSARVLRDQPSSDAGQCSVCIVDTPDRPLHFPNTCKLRRRAVCGQTRGPVGLRDVLVAAGVDEGKPNFDQFHLRVTLSRTRWTIVRLQSGALVQPAPVPLRRSRRLLRRTPVSLQASRRALSPSLEAAYQNQ